MYHGAFVCLASAGAIKTIRTTVRYEEVIKKSRFIAVAAPIQVSLPQCTSRSPNALWPTSWMTVASAVVDGRCGQFLHQGERRPEGTAQLLRLAPGERRYAHKWRWRAQWHCRPADPRRHYGGSPSRCSRPRVALSAWRGCKARDGRPCASLCAEWDSNQQPPNSHSSDNQDSTDNMENFDC